MQPGSRRDFLKASLAFGTVAISTGLQADLLEQIGAQRVAFKHGVASGDPLHDRAIVWTRITPQGTPSSLQVIWEVAADADFRQLLHRGSTSTSAARDYTVKVDLLNLEANRRYHYRFRCNGQQSPTGSLRTLPFGTLQQARFAAISCSNYPAGYFHVYAEIARRDDLDAVLHLGDYLYEYGMGEYGTDDAWWLGRSLPLNNRKELLSLVDYRRRYALYRSDADLQALHGKLPFICVWDDHEIANDTWREGAQNHDDSEGDFHARRQAALQAYFEWMPVRPASPDDELTLFRRFDYGDLLSLHMLDTRVIGRDRQLDYRDYRSPSGFDRERFAADLNDPQRSLLGGQQKDWLLASLADSSATWQVLGQQVLMARMPLPLDVFESIFEGRGLDPLTSASQALARRQGDADELVVPYNLDAWDGYAAEREAVLSMASSLDKNLVVLAGDTHNAWASDLTLEDGETVGVEFAVASVTSPGVEEYLRLGDQAVLQFERLVVQLVDDLHYCNLSQRGYLLTSFSHEQATAEWIFVDTVKARRYRVDTSRGKRLKTLPGAGNRRIVES